MKCDSQVSCTKPKLKDFKDDIFQKRISEKYEEIYYLYYSVYHNDEMFESMINILYKFYQDRSNKLKQIDSQRLQDPKWYCENDSIGIQIYAEKFANNLEGIETKLDYLQEFGIKIVYALPFLDSPEGKSDGGFAVSDFRNVRKDLGTMDNLEHLIESLHARGMCFCMDFIINHTSDEHEWARRAKKGEIEYQKRYYFYDSWYIPNQFDSYGVMGHFFGDIAPDNFTYVPECQKIVMTTFYPYQWDLNFTNPIVFNEVLSNVLFLLNKGVDIIIFNGTSNIWKNAGTSCQNLKPAYVLNYIISMAMQIVCPGCAAYFDIKRHKKRNHETTSSNINNDDENNSNKNNDNENSNNNNNDNNENTNNNNNKNDDDENNNNLYFLNDESESENEKEFVITESGVITADADSERVKAKINSLESYMLENDEEEENIDFDLTTEIGQIHQNFGWQSRLWASLAFNNVHSISYSINAICNRFVGDAYFTRVHSHDDINWGLGFDVELNSLIGNGLGTSDGFQGGIITLYRYLNDFYTGSMHGSFANGVTFAEDLVTGKARLCGTTASLLGLERAKIEEQIELRKLKKKHKKSYLSNLKIAQNNIQKSIDRILLLHAVSASMPSIFFIYYGDELGKFNDYNYLNDPDICKDTRYLQRGKFKWEQTKLIKENNESYQSKIFNGIKSIIDARKKYQHFTENEKTVFLKSFTNNPYFDDNDNEFSENQENEIDDSILIFKRIRSDGKFILFIFNFCQYDKTIHISKNDINGKFRDLITDKILDQINNFRIRSYAYFWLVPISD